MRHFLFIGLAVVAVFSFIGWYRSAKAFREYRNRIEEYRTSETAKEVKDAVHTGLLVNTIEKRFKSIMSRGAVHELFDKPKGE